MLSLFIPESDRKEVADALSKVFRKYGSDQTHGIITGAMQPMDATLENNLNYEIILTREEIMGALTQGVLEAMVRYAEADDQLLSVVAAALQSQLNQLEDFSPKNK